MYQELEKLNLRKPAQDEDIFTFENETNGKLPTDYVEFLKISNGVKASSVKTTSPFGELMNLFP